MILTLTDSDFYQAWLNFQDLGPPISQRTRSSLPEAGHTSAIKGFAQTQRLLS